MTNEIESYLNGEYEAEMMEYKRKHPDYQPGPVKHYTQEEIEEYEQLQLLNQSQ